MQFAAAVSQREKSEEAVEQLIASLRRQINGDISLLTLFLTYHHREEAGQVAARLRQEFAPQVLIGCTCEGVIGGDREIEREPGISVLAGRLPGARLTSFHIGQEEWDDLLPESERQSLAKRVGADKESPRAFLVLGDPFTTPILDLMGRLDDLAPGAPTIGGMASGAGSPGQNVLLCDGKQFDEGVVGARIAGSVRVDTVVSQGCRPIGETLMVTKADGNMIATLGGRNALEVTREILHGLSPEEQGLVQNGLFLGVVINEYQPAFSRGDFLVWNVLGAEPKSGAVAVGDTVRAGQTVQFHVRDADTADEDLRLLMAEAAEDEAAPRGGLIFSCNGRGGRMFPMPHHDIRGVLEAVPETPLAGFFAQGELGPIGGKSFLHGHTASIALFRPLPEDAQTQL